MVVIVLWYWRRQHKRHQHNVQRWEHTVQQGLTEPATLHPEFDPNKCIGSGSCVSACPEQAIGLIGGKAKLINPSVCIGHGACEAACAFDAIKLVFGTEKRGIDIPQVDRDFQTNVPGIFIAGELGGMGLVRKAAEQGRQAIQKVARAARETQKLDIVIVGAGPAGLSASLAAKEAGLRFITIEQEHSLGGTIFHYPRRKIVMAGELKLALAGKHKLGELSKEKLLEFWQTIIQQHPLPIRFDQRLERIESLVDGFRLKTQNQQFDCKHVLLALGRRGTPRKLGVAGESLSKVIYQLREPEQFAGQSVAVVGGGDSAVEAALALVEQPKTTVTLIYRGDAFNRLKPQNRSRLQQAQQFDHLTVLLQSEIQMIEPQRITVKTGEKRSTLTNDTVIVCAGGVAPTDMLRKMGITVSTHYGERIELIDG